jgi:IS1 family transposase
MNILPRDKQIEIIATLCEGAGQRAAARLAGVDRKTVARLALRVGKGCAELHDRRMVGVRVSRIELDEVWSFVGKIQKRVKSYETFSKGDQYTFIAMAGTQKAIISCRIGKRDGSNTDDFAQDLRERVLGAPEISTDGWPSYGPAIRVAFKGRGSHGVVEKTFAGDVALAASHKYSHGDVIAVSYRVANGAPTEISTSYVERQTLSIRMASGRFTRLTNGFSKKLERHAAAVSLYVAYYNWCRPHESLTPDARHQTTPAMALRLTDHVWSISELSDAALAAAPPEPPSDRRRQFWVIKGGKS